MIRRKFVGVRYVYFVQDEAERSRTFCVITALLSQDVVLARRLVAEDEDPTGLAWGAVTIAAGLWEHWATQHGEDPLTTWASNLLTVKQRSE